MDISIVLTSAFLVIAAMSPAPVQSESPDAVENDASAAPATTNRPLPAMPPYEEPTVAWKSYEDAEIAEAICRDRIHEAREEAGQPPLDREPATGEDPMAIWAVDRREDGCSVLVTMGDPEDIRPIPKIEERYALRPAG